MKWIRQLLSRRRLYGDLSEEIQEHLEEKIEELVASGMSRKKAAAVARRQFGNVTLIEEDGRGVWQWPPIENFLTDIRFGARLLRRSLTFTAVAVLTLALGIGANTAVFSIVDAVLLRPLPYKGADRLVAVWSTEIGQAGTKIFAPYGDFEEFKAHSQSFEELAALTWARAGEILTWHGSPHEVLAIPASADFFSLLGVPAALGRTFGPEDVQSGCTVVLAHWFWQTELAATSDVVGSTLTLNGKPCAVAGVMPNGFEFYPKQTSLWTLITPDSGFSQKPLNSVVGIFGRLKPGVSMISAEQELTALHQRVVKESPAGSWVAQTVPIVRDLREQFTWMAGRNLRTALLVLSAAVGLVLLIACFNVANLLIGRSVERQRELAVRAALGSGRFRLMRQLLVESMLLASVGAVAGVLLALTGVRYFNSANPVELPPGNPITVNLHVLGFTTFLATMTGLFFGLVPAWSASQIDLNEVLKRSGRSVTQGKGHRTSKWLVVGQVMLSMILLAGAGLLIESIVRLGSVPLGFRSDHLVTARVALPSAAYSEATQRVTFYGRLIEHLAALPGVEGVALCSSLPPYDGGGSSALAVAGKAAIENLEAVNLANISAAYFRVLSIPLLRGREFDSRDREKSQRVAIVNEEMGRRYFPKEDPVGKQIKLGNADDSAPWLTIAGVVGNEKRTVVYREMGYVEPALVYLPVEQAASTSSMGLVMRVAGNPILLSPLLQSEVTRLDSGVPVYDIRTMTDRYSEFLAHPRFRAIIMGILAALTLLLAAIGIYGVLAQLVSQRTPEIGVRLALGAQPADVFGLVLGEGMKMTVVGVVIGLLGAFGLTRLMSTMLYGVRATDPLVFIGVAILLTLVALSACYVPARRTTRVDPMVALRYE
jgi:predicted permease